MLGQMQETPLRVSSILDHAARYHGDRPVFGPSAEGEMVRSNWRAVARRARRLASALRGLGLEKGDVVGVMAWNSVRHMEVWYGIPGAGLVNHTLNPRLFREQLEYIVTHAEDRAILIDPDLVPVLEGLQAEGRLPGVRHWVILCGAGAMPATSLPDPICYEALLETGDPEAPWTEGAETDPCGLCYTSGTTGNPKGVLYSHRSNVMHALFAATPDCLGLGSSEVVMPVVPLFHANGWGLAYVAPLVGAAMALPGRDMSPAGLCAMFSLGVTFTAAVPTIWLALLPYLRANGIDLPDLRRVVIGGSSCPRAVIEAFRDEYDVQVIHAWGMTEMSPLGAVCTLKPEVLARDAEAQLDAQCTVGHPPWGVDLRIADEDGRDLPWDGAAQGRLLARGPGVLRRYHKAAEEAVDAEGWFDTGDVATMDPHGYVRITDRSKDVIKSGGEWISSIELENAAIAHPDVAEAAAIGVAHPKWGERPVLCIVARAGTAPPDAQIIALIEAHVARWQLPDEILRLESLPHTATGKISKLGLRRELEARAYRHPDLRRADRAAQEGAGASG